jgi:hypothetical protein
MLALPFPRLSAWTPADSVPLALKPTPGAPASLYNTVTSFGATGELFPSIIANIASSLAVPLTAIVPDAKIVALPDDCIRSPVLLSPVELLEFVTLALLAIRVTSAPNCPGPVEFDASTASPPGLLTMTSGSSVRLIGVLFELTLILLL